MSNQVPLNRIFREWDPCGQATTTVQQILQSAVAPRPVALVSTVNAQGDVNLSPFSFFNVFGANPPILIFSPARRVKNNTTKHTLDNALATKQVVINVVNYAIVQQMSLSSSDYPQGVNEFEKAGFTMLPSEKIQPFRVAESPVQFECKVNDVIFTGEKGGAGNLIVCEVLKIHISDQVLADDGSIDQHKIDLVARAGGSFYTRARDGFFEIPKPITTIGIGVDALPIEIKNSKVLTGNNLGLLGNITQLPTQEAVNNFGKEHPKFIGLETTKKHTFVQEYLKNNDVESAWKVLLLN